MLRVSFGQLLPAVPPKTSCSWAMLCLQQALGSSGGTSLPETRYCTLVLVMAPCFCRRWSRSWLLWRKCRLHFSHCGAKKQGVKRRPPFGAPNACSPPEVPGHTRCEEQRLGLSIPSFQHILVYGIAKEQSPSGDDSDRHSTKLHI